VKNSNPVRKGSIPMVLIVVICLGIVAGAAIFNSGNAARQDKISELNQAAWIISQAAVEETIVKCSNSTAAPLDGKRQTFQPRVTALTVGLPDSALKIAPVELVARTLDDKTKKTDQTAVDNIYALAALVPGFWKSTNPGMATNPAAIKHGSIDLADMSQSPAVKAKPGDGVELDYDITWRKKMFDIQAATPNTFDPVLLKAIKYAVVPKDPSKPKVTAQAFAESSLSGNGGNESAQQYFNNNIKTAGNAESDNNNNPAHPKVLDLFKKVPTLPYLGPFADEATASTAAHDAGTLATFSKAYNDATVALADHMQSRINGCNGDFNYAIGGLLTGLGRGTPCANDSDAGEETYRKDSRDSGLTEYKEGLLTLSTKVHLTLGAINADQSYTAHRIMRQMNLNTIMAGVGQSMLGYLHGYFNLTRADMITLGFMGKLDPASITKLRDINDDTALPSGSAEMFGEMNTRYNVYGGNTQVRNAALANCLATPK